MNINSKVEKICSEGEGAVYSRLLCGCLAQLVERRPYKANVGSSTLSAPTTDFFWLFLRQTYQIHAWIDP